MSEELQTVVAEAEATQAPVEKKKFFQAQE